MGILTKEEFNKALYEYYMESCGERKTDIWYEQPSVNVWIFERDGAYINLNSHILTGKVTETVMDHLPYNVEVATRPFAAPDAEDEYTVVDMTEWKRTEIFNRYVGQAHAVMSLTVDINVAPLAAYARENGLDFFPCMLWAVSKVINSHDEFKYSQDEKGKLILWKTVLPCYSEFNAEDESMTKYVVEYSDDMREFYTQLMASREKSALDAAELPKNIFDASCLPWVRYRHFDMFMPDDGNPLAPRVAWGKYEEECRGAILPLTMNIHYAVADGFHISRFFCEVQALIDEMAEWVK